MSREPDDFRVTDCHHVVPALERIIAICRQRQSPIAYFALLYRVTTLKIVAAVDAGDFEDNARMAAMDKNFANRYLGAVGSYLANEPTTAAWDVAFRAAENPELTVLQHLFLGMNAHINLDLAVAAAETCPGEAIYAFEADFAKINLILESLFDLVEHDIAKFWHPLKLMLPLGEKAVNHLLSLGMEAERRKAWQRAVELALLPEAERPARIRQRDLEVAQLGQRILDPGPILEPILHELCHLESGTVADKIQDFETQASKP